MYVGKISPHKAPHDLVKMLEVLRLTVDPAARLHLVGSPLGETYEPALRAFVSELGLDSVVNFAGSVSGAELEAYFQAADVFVMASDHEGFCVPLGEAMGHGVPIVAYGVTAVPETVGGAGLVLPDKSPGAVRGRGGAGAGRCPAARGVVGGGAGAGGWFRSGGVDPALRVAGAGGRGGALTLCVERAAWAAWAAGGRRVQRAARRSTMRSPAVGRSRAATRWAALSSRPRRRAWSCLLVCSMAAARA